MFGRRLILQTSNLFFIVFTLACGFSQTAVQLTALRFFCGLGGSAPLVIGGGVVADLYAPENRGAAVSAYSLMPLLGPCIGPLVGGWIVQKLDSPDRWRWIFWASTIFAACVAGFGLIVLPETYQPRILELKCRKLKKETGNEKLHTIFDLTVKENWKQRYARSISRPLVLLATQPIVIALAVLMAVMYGCMYLFLVSRYRSATTISSADTVQLISRRHLRRYFKKSTAKTWASRCCTTLRSPSALH